MRIGEFPEFYLPQVESMSALSSACKRLRNFSRLKIHRCICRAEVGLRMLHDINLHFRELSVGGGEICFSVTWDWSHKNDNYYWLLFSFDPLRLLNVNRAVQPPWEDWPAWPPPLSWQYPEPIDALHDASCAPHQLPYNVEMCYGPPNPWIWPVCGSILLF